MSTTRIHPHGSSYAIVAPATEQSLQALSFSPDFRCILGGDPDRVRWMLRGVATHPEGRVAIAVADAHIVGFVALLPPQAGDRFYTVGHVLELTAAEVIDEMRGQGVFRTLFSGALRTDLDDHIVYAVADPAFRNPRESIRAFRDRMQATLGSLGFFPHPTDHPGVVIHRDAAFLVRIGRGVPRSAVDDFFAHLRSPEERQERVAIFLKDSGLRNLVRTDLERHDFEIVAVGAEPGPVCTVDAVITDHAAPAAAAVNAQIVDDEIQREKNGVLYVPAGRLDRLPQLLRREVARTRNTRWPRSSKNASRVLGSNPEDVPTGS